METLVLSTLARTPMHGYELKLELRYKHVGWWAKFEHSHLYAALGRLLRQGYVREVHDKTSQDGRARRVLAITAKGRKRLAEMLEAFGAGGDHTYFDVDLFFTGSYLLERRKVVSIVKNRLAALGVQLREARRLEKSMGELVPAMGRLVIEHRIGHLTREIQFAERALREIEGQARWGSFLGSERISDFIARTRVELESEPARASKRRAAKRGGRSAR
jgi:DNA-binding PadR family transcriptional regulator